ncbi:MAG: carbohydrate porin [Caulobacteraceae bacterium]|nr:carbohydrate porin [Caulobacteraceae bacterium]
MRYVLISAAAAAAFLAPAAALADDAPGAAAPAAQAFAFHVQFTDLTQYQPAFHSAYRGANSLDPHEEIRSTNDLTAYLGVRPWKGAEIWINPEIDQGFGLSNTLGVAGFPSGEAYKVGANTPYFRMQRFFLRQTVDLGGKREAVDADLNQLAGAHSEDRLVFTVGKFSVGDVFDTNKYAHDPRNDFMNWTVIDSGTFDYAADAWGYTYGAAAEWYRGDWTWRAGLFDLSNVPNSKTLDPHFDQFQTIAEIERRFSLGGQPGAARVTGFLTRGRMGHFNDALALAAATGQPADASLVRKYSSRGGVSLTLEQQLVDDLGAFLRAGYAEGDAESYEFTDVDRTVSAGLSLGGKRWGRADDTIGAAFVVNGASGHRLAYLAAGGLGILIGDGKLIHSGDEAILETYYDLAVVKAAHLSLDYQYIQNPGYNRDRGPVSVFGLRAHLQY